MITGIILILIPLLVYVLGALSVKRKGLIHPDDFFVAYKRVGETAFSSSSVAYAFQVSTIYPFLLWGASKFYFVPLVNSICWGLGILLFYLCFDKYKHFIGKELTLHGFLGEQYGPSVRVVASYLTILAFLGFAISETYFGSKVLLSIIDNKIVFYSIISFSLLFVYGYIAYGGQISSIRTDQLQLIVSYVGVFGILLYFIYLLISLRMEIPVTLSWGLLALAVYTIGVSVFRRFRFIKFNESKNTDNVINRLLNTIIVIVFGLVAIFSAYSFFVLPRTSDSGLRFFNLEGFGIPGLLSLIILPLCFQFVDLTNWQRLLSVKPDNANKNIKRGLLIYAFESPFTWLIFVFFGLLAVTSLSHFTFQDLLVDIPKQLINSSNSIQVVLGFVFIISVLAIMLSTVDSFIMGVIFTYVYDSNSKTRKLLDSKNETKIKENYSFVTNKGRIFGLLALLAGLLFFIVFDQNVQNGGELFINLMLAFYSAQIAFFPHIIGILFLKKHPATLWANVSMLVGALSGVSIGIYAVLYKQEWAWYPILVCFASSSIIYAFGVFVKKNKV